MSSYVIGYVKAATVVDISSLEASLGSAFVLLLDRLLELFDQVLVNLLDAVYLCEFSRRSPRMRLFLLPLRTRRDVTYLVLLALAHANLLPFRGFGGYDWN